MKGLFGDAVDDAARSAQQKARGTSTRPVLARTSRDGLSFRWRCNICNCWNPNRSIRCCDCGHELTAEEMAEFATVGAKASRKLRSLWIIPSLLLYGLPWATFVAAPRLIFTALDGGVVLYAIVFTHLLASIMIRWDHKALGGNDENANQWMAICFLPVIGIAVYLYSRGWETSQDW